MGIRIDGNNDLINAADGSLTVEGLSIDVTGIVTASGGYKVGSAYTVFSNGNVATSGVVTATSLDIAGNTTIASNGRFNIYRPTGTATNTALQINSNVGSTDSTQFIIQAGGSVGIKSAIPTSGFTLDVGGDVTIGEPKGNGNSFLDQKEDGDLHIINSGRTANGASGSPGTAGVGINRFNTRAGGTSLFRDFCVYNGKDTKVLVVDGSASAVGIGTDAPDGALTIAHSGSSTDFLMFNRPGSVGTFARMGHNTSGGTNMLDIRSEGNTRFLTGGNNERLRIDSSGVITLGNISNTVLQASICNSVSGHQFISQCDDNNNGFEIYQKHGSTSTRNTLSVHANTGTSSAKKTQFLVRGDGNVGINPDASGPDRLLHVSDSNQAGVVTPFRLTNVTGQSGTEVRMEFECGVDEIAYIGAKNEGSDIGPLMFATASSQAAYPTEKMRLTNDGRLLVHTTTSYNGYISSYATAGQPYPIAAIAGNTSQGLIGFYYSTSLIGSITYGGGSTAYNTSSDYRLKENVTPISDGITRLKTLKPSRFNFKVDKDTTVDGFLAHEVSSIVPEAITGSKDEVDSDNNPVYQQIDQSKIVPVLTAALQEAIAKIETLETKVAALEG